MRRDDAVEIAGNRTQTISGGNVAVLEVLDLLQNRVWRARNENIAGQQQNRQAVDVGGAGCRDQIGAARPNGRCDGHHAAAEMRFGVGHGGKRHALFIVRAESREGFLDRMQRFAETGHIAMPEDRPHTAKQRLRAVLRLHPLRCQIANQRLRHRQPNRSHSHTSIICIHQAVMFPSTLASALVKLEDSLAITIARSRRYCNTNS